MGKNQKSVGRKKGVQIMGEQQKETTELYRLNYLIALSKKASSAEVRKAKRRVNKIRGFEFYKGVK